MKILMFLSSAFLMSVAGIATAASGGLAISKIWTRDGQVIVSFDCYASLDWNICAACPAAYSQTTNYSGMLATLLAAQAEGRHVTIYTASGGAPLQSLIDTSVPNVWAQPISLVAIEPN
jgi:hypothetical protein